MMAIPLERFHNLSDLPHAGHEISVAATPDELQRLAEWAGVDAVSRFEARIRIVPQSRAAFHIETEFEADVVQNCVVTLVPVTSHIARSFTRTLHLRPGPHRHPDHEGITFPASADEDAPEEIESLRYDVAGPLREEFALAIEPYPRAPGVEFDPPSDADASAESPFAPLEKLRHSTDPPKL
ncbi:MAG TPA: YceD family protein [Rhizomicrobium sp.]